MSLSDEVTLAQRIANGDRQAENELFRLYGEQIRFMVQARLRWKIPSADFEDIIGDIQTAVLLSLRKGGYDPQKGNSLGAYLAGIVVRVIAQYFRNQKKSQVVEFEFQAMEPSNSPDALNDMMTAEHNQRIRKCLKRLSPKYRKVLLLRFYEQRSIEEIANKLNLEPRRVSERIHYSLKKLLKEYKQKN